MRHYLSLSLVATLLAATSASSWEPVSSVPVQNKYGKKTLSLTPEKPLFVSGGAKKVKTAPKKASVAKSTKVPKKAEVAKKASDNDALVKMSTIWAATVFTYHINNKSGLGGGPVRACSVTALLASLFSPSLAVVAMLGGIAGMAKSAVIPSTEASLFLGVLTILVMAFFEQQKLILGVGGRLGVAAQFACSIQFILAGLLGMNAGAGAALVGTYPSTEKLINGFPPIAGFAILGALFMRLWQGTLSSQGSNTAKRFSTSVASAGATGIAASYFLPAEAVPPTFMGGLVAMSAPTRIPNLSALLGATVLAAVAHQLLAGVLLGGWSGKLGCAAALGVLMYSFLAKLFGL